MKKNWAEEGEVFMEKGRLQSAFMVCQGLACLLWSSNRRTDALPKLLREIFSGSTHQR